MAVFRIEKTRDYTVMSNYHLRDMSLSLKAKGLLSLMLSLPENWDYTMKGLASICKDGIDSISGGIRELEAHGYLIRSRVRSANGQLGSIEYTILEQPKAPSPTQEKPIRENPVQANPMLDAPIQENPAQLNKEESSNYPSKTDLSITQESSPMIDGGEHINIVSYGGGANSTALLIGLHQHRIPVDLILFADTGGEHPHTYAYLDIMDRWLKDHGMPEIARVYKTTKDGNRLTLEDECLKSGTLPSIAYGFKRCSLKHKIGPQEKFCNNYPPCREVWASGKKVVKFIGYDAGEHYRSNKVLLRDLADPKYSKWYPLMEWGWDRAACIRAIEAADLPQPGKSSCFFCPSMRAEEIIDLREHYPDLFRRALALEDNARANLKTVQGLGRNYSWRERFGKEFI